MTPWAIAIYCCRWSGPIATSKQFQLVNVMILITPSLPAAFSWCERWRSEVSRFVKILESCRSLRRLGSCGSDMCYVASGRLDAYWATSIAPWDCAAGVVIAREAGAELSAYDGGPFDDWSPRFCLSSTVKLHDQMTKRLSL